MTSTGRISYTKDYKLYCLQTMRNKVFGNLNMNLGELNLLDLLI